MTNENVSKLKIPSIGLVVVGIINILAGLYFLLSGITVLYLGITYKNFQTEQEKLAFNIGLYGIIAWGVLSLIVAPLIIYGAMKLMRGEKFGAAKTSAITAMIPLTSFAFLLGIPFGIWVLSALAKVKKSENFQLENSHSKRLL